MKRFRKTWVCLATTTLATLAVPGYGSQEGSAANVFYQAVKGDWQGSLEYRDYSNNQRVTLPTTLRVEPARDGTSVLFRYRYDEGRGRFVESVDTIRIDPANGKYVVTGEGDKEPDVYTITGLAEFASKRQGELVLTGTGTEKGRNVDVRKTIKLDEARFSMLRETRIPGEPFQFRNQYTFKHDKSQ